MIRLILALLNLLGFPGIGTLLAGHKKTGIIQLLLGMSGFVLTVLPFLPLLKILVPRFADSGNLLQEIQNGTLLPPEQILTMLGYSILGMLLFFCNWLWSSFTTKPRPQTPPPLPGQAPR